jgi:hypothetical protein
MNVCKTLAFLGLHSAFGPSLAGTSAAIIIVGIGS